MLDRALVEGALGGADWTNAVRVLDDVDVKAVIK